MIPARMLPAFICRSAGLRSSHRKSCIEETPESLCSRLAPGNSLDTHTGCLHYRVCITEHTEPLAFCAACNWSWWFESRATIVQREISAAFHLVLLALRCLHSAGARQPDGLLICDFTRIIWIKRQLLTHFQFREWTFCCSSDDRIQPLLTNPSEFSDRHDIHYFLICAYCQ